MTKREWNALNTWQPSPELWLNTLYHPSVGKEHPFFDRLPALKRKLVVALDGQYERWSHKLYFKNGLSDRLIAALNGYDRAEKLSDCMMIPNPYVQGVPFSRCNLDWFCEFCAYLKGQDMLKKYADSWEPGAWFEMVISLEVGLRLSHPGHDDMGDVWDAMESIIRRLKEENFMQGYVGWREIKVHSFWPYGVCTPHIHILLRCDHEPDRDILKKVVNETWATWRPLPKPGLFGSEGWYTKRLRQIRLLAVPDVFLEPLKSEAHFHEILQYIKPIDLFGPYESGFHAAKAVDQVELFHQEVRQFFYSLPNETADYQERFIKKTRKRELMLVARRRFFYGGICHGSASHPLGLKEAVRRTKEHQDAIRSKVLIARETEDQHRQADNNQPVA